MWAVMDCCDDVLWKLTFTTHYFLSEYENISSYPAYSILYGKCKLLSYLQKKSCPV